MTATVRMKNCNRCRALARSNSEQAKCRLGYELIGGTADNWMPKPTVHCPKPLTNNALLQLSRQSDAAAASGKLAELERHSQIQERIAEAIAANGDAEILEFTADYIGWGGQQGATRFRVNGRLVELERCVNLTESPRGFQYATREQGQRPHTFKQVTLRMLASSARELGIT
jgi:hypothetical protein